MEKNDDEDLDEEDILLRNKCREMSDEELKNIVPVWTTNIEKCKGQFIILHILVQIVFLCDVILKS